LSALKPRARLARLGLTTGEAPDLNGALRGLAQLAAGLHGLRASRRLQVGDEGASLGGVAFLTELHRCESASRARFEAGANTRVTASRRSRQTAAAQREQSISASRRSPADHRNRTDAGARSVSALA